MAKQKTAPFLYSYSPHQFVKVKQGNYNSSKSLMQNPCQAGQKRRVDRGGKNVPNINKKKVKKS